jgi:dUTPase
MYTLKLKPLNKITKELYTNQQHFHDGDVSIDIFFQEDYNFSVGVTELISLGFKAEITDENGNNITYQLKPRLSIYKLPLRQSNSVSIINAGYREELKVPIDRIITSDDFTCDLIDITSCDNRDYYDFYTNYLLNTQYITPVKKGDRLFQLCTLDMKPFKLQVLKEDEELSDSTYNKDDFRSTKK